MKNLEKKIKIKKKKEKNELKTENTNEGKQQKIGDKMANI